MLLVRCSGTGTNRHLVKLQRPYTLFRPGPCAKFCFYFEVPLALLFLRSSYLTSYAFLFSSPLPLLYFLTTCLFCLPAWLSPASKVFPLISLFGASQCLSASAQPDRRRARALYPRPDKHAHVGFILFASPLLCYSSFLSIVQIQF
jgi:hypothetical protein